MNQFVSEIIVPESYHGQRVDKTLADLFPDFSRSQLTSWLKDGSILVNNAKQKPNTKILGGETIALNVSPPKREDVLDAEDIALDIVFEDEHILIINKPAGLVVHPGAGNHNHTLVNALLFHDIKLQHLPRAGIVHRLDKDTTGLLIVAKTLNAHTHLIRQMQAREIDRHYIALVHGHLISGDTIDTSFGRDSRNRLKMAVSAHGRQAITQFKVLKQYQYLTLIEVKLLTGRTHQIRVHMSHINHAVVGDQLYGSRNNLRAGMSLELRGKLNAWKRQALHATSLELKHPETNEIIKVTAPLPDDFKDLLTFLDDECE